MLNFLRALMVSPRPKRVARERFLFPQEWERVKPIIEQTPPKVRVYFSILILEGSRRDELRTAQWSQFDLTPGQGIWYKPKTKTGRSHTLPLSDLSVDLLSQLPRTGLYVFPGETPDRPWSRTAVRYWWRKIRRLANCPDVRIHDLRRTAASWMTMHGENLKMVQSMLNHSSLLTTQIYARLDLSSLRAALNRHAGRFFGS